MHILVVGAGAREHALCWRLSRDPDVDRVVCAPGNAGLAREFTTTTVDLLDPEALVALAARERIDLTVIGPEAPLERGAADLFRAHGRPVFGPSRRAAQVETSKAFAKQFMSRHGIPTARYQVTADVREAMDVVHGGELGPRVVVKADGLAAGKGVVVADTPGEAEQAIRAAMIDGAFGSAGTRIVLEERLEGPEISFFVLASGAAAVPLVAAQDHKRAFDDDEGPNTGGMGAFAPSPLVDEALESAILHDIVRPVLGGLIAEGTPYCGVLYCGLMLTTDGPKVIEFNARFGDPEAQVVLPMIADPLAPMLWAAATGTLTPRRVAVRAEAHVGVVLAAPGYPGQVRLGSVIEGLDRVAEECRDVLVFHAGVGSDATPGGGAALRVAGGRVLTVVGRGQTFEAAIARAYEAVSRIRFDGMHYRRDIGRKALAVRR